MFTQSKKGFTLIELMVVIVIIGILAAIAIPKLFGMSAKAKAQEVGPAAGTWSKLQLAYKMETGKFGSTGAVGYKLPGNADASGEKSETGNFTYTAKDEKDWKAVSKFAFEACGETTEWLGKFGSSDVPEMKITPKGTSAKLTDCESLTPNFYRIGCADASATDATYKDDKCPGSTPPAGGDGS